MCKSHLDWDCKSHLGAQFLESLISILSLVSSWNKLQYSLHFYKKSIRIMFSNKKVKSQKIISRRYHYQKWQAPALLTHISGGRFLGSFCGSKKKKRNDFFFFFWQQDLRWVQSDVLKSWHPLAFGFWLQHLWGFRRITVWVLNTNCVILYLTVIISLKW